MDADAKLWGWGVGLMRRVWAGGTSIIYKMLQTPFMEGSYSHINTMVTEKTGDKTYGHKLSVFYRILPPCIEPS